MALVPDDSISELKNRCTMEHVSTITAFCYSIQGDLWRFISFHDLVFRSTSSPYVSFPNNDTRFSRNTAKLSSANFYSVMKFNSRFVSRNTRR